MLLDGANYVFEGSLGACTVFLGFQRRRKTLRSRFFAPLKGSCFFRFCGRRRPAADAAVGRRRPPAANIGGVAAHCCGIFSCTNPPVCPVGGVVVAVTAFLVFIHHTIVFHGFSLFLMFSTDSEVAI